MHSLCHYRWTFGGHPPYYYCTLPSKHAGPHRDRYSGLTRTQKRRRRRRAADERGR